MGNARAQQQGVSAVIPPISIASFIHLFFLSQLFMSQVASEPPSTDPTLQDAAPGTKRSGRKKYLPPAPPRSLQLLSLARHVLTSGCANKSMNSIASVQPFPLNEVSRVPTDERKDKGSPSVDFFGQSIRLSFHLLPPPACCCGPLESREAIQPHSATCH